MKKILTFAVILLIGAGSNVFAAGGGTDIMDLLPRIFNFAVLFGVIFYFARKPMAAAFRNVLKQKSSGYFQEKNQEKLEREKLEDYEKKIKVLHEELEDFKREYQEEIKLEKTRIIEEAESTAKIIKNNAEKLIEGKIANARKNLVQHVITKTIAELKKELSANPNMLNVADMNEKFIATVKDKIK